MRGRGGALLLAGLAPAALLALDPGGWHPFAAPTWLAVATLVPAGAALVLGRGSVRLAPVPTVAAAVLVLAMVLGAATGADGVLAWIGLPARHLGAWTWVLLVVAMVAGQALDPERDGPVLVGGLAAAGLGVGAVAAAEALGWEPAVLDITPGRLTGTLGSAAYLGAAAALLAPAALGAALDRSLPRGLRAVGAAAVPLLVVAVAGSGARAAWVGLAGAALVTAWVRRADLRARPRATAVAVTAGALAVGLVVLVTPVGSRVAALTDPDEAGGRGRVDEWRVAARVVADHPLTGVGPEGYRIAFGTAADERYERAHGRDPQPDRAHSAPLDVALAGGLPALAAWGVVVVAVLAAAARALGATRPWLAGVGAGVVAHHVGSLLLFPTAELDPIAWLLGGLLLGATIGARPQPEQTSRLPGGPPLTLQVPRPVLVLLGVLAAVGALAGVTEVVAERRAGDAVAALARGDARAAERAVAGATDLRPDVVHHHLLAARVAGAAERGTVAALAAVDDALAVSPGDPIARRARAALLVDRARATGVPAHAALARTEVDRYLEDDPVSAALWRHAGAAALLDGDPAVAQAAWERAEDLAPRSAAAPLDLALLHLDAGHTDRAVAALGRARRADPDDPRIDPVTDLVEAATLGERGDDG